MAGDPAGWLGRAGLHMGPGYAEAYRSRPDARDRVLAELTSPIPDVVLGNAEELAPNDHLAALRAVCVLSRVAGQVPNVDVMQSLRSRYLIAAVESLVWRWRQVSESVGGVEAADVPWRLLSKVFYKTGYIFKLL